MSPAPRTAIITGAAQGVGRAIALRLSTDGCQVVVSDLLARQSLLDDLVSEITRTGRAAVAVTADVSVERDVEDLVAEAVVHFGSIDIMVCWRYFFASAKNFQVANDDVAAPTAPTILDSKPLAVRLTPIMYIDSNSICSICRGMGTRLRP